MPEHISENTYQSDTEVVILRSKVPSMVSEETRPGRRTVKIPHDSQEEMDYYVGNRKKALEVEGFARTGGSTVVCLSSSSLPLLFLHSLVSLSFRSLSLSLSLFRF